MLAPFKCPLWFAFLDDLPKTAGKIQRFKLRETAALSGRTTQSAPA
jgi:acyl-coenzyme A synthetase/AMP-(fatty) acid ligase